jgi:hypothetical protein
MISSKPSANAATSMPFAEGCSVTGFLWMGFLREATRLSRSAGHWFMATDAMRRTRNLGARRKLKAASWLEMPGMTTAVLRSKACRAARTTCSAVVQGTSTLEGLPPSFGNIENRCQCRACHRASLCQSMVSSITYKRPQGRSGRTWEDTRHMQTRLEHFLLVVDGLTEGQDVGLAGTISSHRRNRHESCHIAHTWCVVQSVGDQVFPTFALPLLTGYAGQGDQTAESMRARRAVKAVERFLHARQEHRNELCHAGDIERVHLRNRAGR